MMRRPSDKAKKQLSGRTGAIPGFNRAYVGCGGQAGGLAEEITATRRKRGSENA